MGESCIEVVCGCCLIAGAPLYSEGKVDYYTEEAFADLLDKGKSDKVRVWQDAQRLRDQGLSIREIAEKLRTPKTSISRHTVGKKKAVPLGV